MILKLFLKKEIEPARKPEDLFAALLDKRRYKRVFDTLRKRAKKDKHRYSSYANHPELTLRWILSHEKLVTKWILKNVRKKKYTVSPAKEISVIFDKKERMLYRLEWPDRILQTVLAEALSELLDRQFSNKLFSFRKGYSVWQAVGLAVKYVRKNNKSPLYVLKRDVKSYGDSISHKILFRQMIEKLPNVDLFVIDLIKQFIKYDYVGIDGESHKKTVGLPTGMPLNCVLENLYLMKMDKAMVGMNLDHQTESNSKSPCIPLYKRGSCYSVEEPPRISYMRYGDDIWVASCDYKIILNAKNKLDDICAELELKWNEKKCGDYLLENQKENIQYSTRNFQCQSEKTLIQPGIRRALRESNNSLFHVSNSITHLGISITADGTVVIPREKIQIWRKQLKQILRRADYRSRLMKFDERTRLRQLIYFANKFFFDQNLRFRKIDYLLTIVTKENYFIELDRWVAMVILSVLHGRFSKTNFRKTPFKVLKKEGLESLYMRRKGMMKRQRRHR